MSAELAAAFTDIVQPIAGTPLEPALVGLFGLLLGSYATLLSWRLPRGEPTAATRSRCPVCRRALGPLDLIPVLSWALRRGRCGCPRRLPVPLRYPLIELAAGGLALLVWARFGVSVEAALALIFAIAGLVLAVAGLESRRLPVQPALAILAAGLAWQTQRSGLTGHGLSSALTLAAALTPLMLALAISAKTSQDSTRIHIWERSAALSGLVAWGGVPGGLIWLGVGLAVFFLVPDRSKAESQIPELLIWMALLLMQFSVVISGFG